MIQGSCLCGGIRFEIDESQIFIVINCYCVNCRKVSGAAYGTFMQMYRNGFHWLSGEELVATFESSPGNHRAFCKVCGSRAPQFGHWIPERATATVPGGLLDDDPGVKPHASVFTDSKAPWDTIDNSLPSTPRWPTPEFWQALGEKLRQGS